MNAPSFLERAVAKHALDIVIARRDPAAFNEYALRHEKTNARLRNGVHHVAWQTHLSANKRAVLFAPVEHGKTQQVGVGRLLHEIGKDPTKRFAIISDTATQAMKVLGAVKQNIERDPDGTPRNARVHEVFPGLEPSRREAWGGASITVERPTIAKDPTLQATGIGGPINGSRLDGVILDDVLDFDNTRTPEQRQKLVEWYDSTVGPRLGEDAFVWFIGTPWHPEDLMHTLAARPGFASQRYSAVLNPMDPQEQWEPLWPEQFSTERLIETYASTTPYNFGRKYLCQTRIDAQARFQQAWLDGMVKNGERFRSLSRQPSTHGIAWPCFTGVDLGVGQKEENDLTVLFTIAIEPGDRRRRVVVEIQAGRWQAPEIIDRIQDVHRRYNSIIVVESNGAQQFLVQFSQGLGLPVRPFNTSAQSKYHEHFGVESLAVEIRNGLWVLPSDGGVDVQGKEWMREMLFFTPEGHTGDRLMAAWFAREAVRNYAPSIFGTQEFARP